MLNRKPNKSMEETKLIQCTKTQTPKSPSTSQNLPPQAPPLLQNKKRKFDNVDIQNSNYFKILAVVKELRPYFIEVLRTPDYQNCKAAHEIQKQMKLMMDLYKQMTMESVSIGKSKNLPKVQPLSGECRRDEEKPRERQQEENRVEQPQSNRVPGKFPEGKPPLPRNNFEKKKKKKIEDVQIQGTYIVGGSAFGWNFIMFPGSKPVYYGETKESRRTTK